MLVPNRERAARQLDAGVLHARVRTRASLARPLDGAVPAAAATCQKSRCARLLLNAVFPSSSTLTYGLDVKVLAEATVKRF
ncbi:unnamed protein product [Mesocestoides corti]|uniref:Uncharacterized protein n=1 Tax=Mesocestoides corti TaxID=53468 RepID=A0A0R3UFJ6_MESCO|nr:unnamed protein product [Mesocestoides corti]